MPRLVVIHGPAETGKLAAMWATAAQDRDLRTLHRDQVRVLFGRLVSEAHLSEIMVELAISLLSRGYGVVTCAQNQSDRDVLMWEWAATEAHATIEWRSGLG